MIADRRTLAVVVAHPDDDAYGIAGTVALHRHEWLGLPDGKVADVPFEELVALIAEILDEEQPVVVATFGADGIFGHPDHTAVGAVASRIVAGLRGTAGCNVSPGVGASSARGDGSPAQPVTAVVGHRQRGGHRRTGEEEQHVAD